MEGTIVFFLVVIQNLVSCQVQEATESPDLSTSTRDPYGNVFSQLSDVILDVEDRLYRLTAPKYEAGDSKASLDENKENRRRNYFDRVRDNYKTLQDQLGQSLSSGGVIKMADILNLNFQNKGSRSSLDLSLPFLPLKLQVDAKKPRTSEKTEKVDTDQNKGSRASIDLSLPFLPLSVQVDAKKPQTSEKTENVDTDPLKINSPFSDVSGNINLGLKGLFDKDTIKTAEENQETVKPEFQKRSSRPIRSASEPNKKLINTGKSSKLSVDSSKFNNKQLKVKEAESGIEGRILGDLLYSEASFDKYFKRFLKDHGKWLLDSNISPPKKIIEGIRDLTRNRFTAGTSTKSTTLNEIPTSSTNKKDPNFHGHRQPGFLKNNAASRIILAFTQEGLPLKLKIDLNVSKPLKFLHKILSEARVSLNIPVSTANGIQPVGNGVLNLGEDSGKSSRTPLLDLSDNDQLDYLLRTLKKLRYDHHH